METLQLEEISDREEGEIIDDLEDVSDCSLTSGSPLNPGKSVSPPENLNGVCLSKASSRLLSSESFVHYAKSRPRLHHKKRHSLNGRIPKKSHSKCRRPSIIEIATDSEDEVTDPRYAKQLREALCRESAESTSHNNSLKTRLKVLIDNNSHSEDESNIDTLRDLALLSTIKPLQSDNGVEVCTSGNEASDFNSETLDGVDPELQELRLEALKSVILKNHERRKRKANQISDNDNGANNVDVNKENDQSIINNKILKMDTEDVTVEGNDAVDSKTAIENADIIEEDADILRAVLLASMSNNLSTKPSDTAIKIPFTLPKVIVKPLIINLNADSDSDTETPESTTPTNSLKNTVSEFLKRQRAEAEANNVKKKVNTPTFNINKRNDLGTKSVMKLLPRSQQLEYHKLKQQLLNAHKKVKTRRNSHRVVYNNKKDVLHTNSTKKLPFYKTATSLTNHNRILVNNKISKDTAEKKPNQTVGNLQNALNDLQITVNGRLQMKGKYRSLGPLLDKINKASHERQQHEILIKKLLQEIQIARTKLATSHQNFTNLVQQLVKDKRSIDKGVHAHPTPIAVSSVSKEVQKIKTAEPETLQETNAKLQDDDEPTFLDPNDITKVFVQQISDDINIPKYKSPLNYRDSVTDSTTTICPYDLLGVCKDKECQYVHYS